MAVFFSSSAEETTELTRRFGATLKGGDTVLLCGDLGAGKTMFAKGVALGMGITEEVTSPTYAYMNEYEGTRYKLYHYDCYRIESAAQAEGLGLADYFYAGGVCLVEWSENIAELLPPACIRVTIEKTGENTREIRIA